MSWPRKTRGIPGALLSKTFRRSKSPLSATTNTMKRRARLSWSSALPGGKRCVDYRRWHAWPFRSRTRLIRACINRELPFTIVPGPSSILTALIGSGFSTERFSFRGFLPVKSGRRERELRIAAQREETALFFESPYRLLKTLAACNELMPDRQLRVARELTKKFEEFRCGNTAELLTHYEAHPAKGEIVLVVSGVNSF